MQFLQDINVPSRGVAHRERTVDSMIRRSTNDDTNPGKQSLNTQDEILSLIKDRRWAELRTLIRRRDIVREVVQDDTTCSEHGIDGNPFHLLCSYRPPRDIVSVFLQQFPQFASEVDSHKRTALHIAIDYSAEPETVMCLIRRHPAFAEQKDALGKTPLIHACEKATEDPRSIAIIEALVSASLYTILEEDDSEQTALEHAIIAGAPKRLIRELQKTYMAAAYDVRSHGGVEKAKKALQEKIEMRKEAKKNAKLKDQRQWLQHIQSAVSKW